MRSALACALRCFTGYSNSGSIRANRASVCASSRSSFLRLSPISRTLRAFATITSCPKLPEQATDPRRMRSDFQRDPAARHRTEDLAQQFRIRADALLQLYLAGFVQHAVPAVAIS